MLKEKLYKGKHAIAVIHDARFVINQHYKGKGNDGAMLVVAGDVNNAGKIIKAAALGANIIGYSTSLLIANAENNQSEKHSDIKKAAERIY
jgi:glutamate synthase domain-containing protein 2